MNCVSCPPTLAAAWLGLLVCAAPPGLAAEPTARPTVAVADLDRPRILHAAAVALALAPVTIIWHKPPADPTEAEVQRNIAITQPLLWIK